MTEKHGAEPRPDHLPLQDRNAANLSLYSPREERAALEKISKKAEFSLQIIPLGVDTNGNNLGYLVVPENKDMQKRMIAAAPWNLIDFDDTQGPTTLYKEKCWEQIEGLGVPMPVIRICDKLARVTFNEEDGEQYQAELDMRLLTYAQEHPIEDTHEMQRQLERYRDEILGSPEDATTVFEEHMVNPAINDIFHKTRFAVDPYPDTKEVLTHLRGEENNIRANQLTLTYGEPTFQLGKVLWALQNGLTQGVILTKAKKGPTLETLFEQNPWKDLDITYTDARQEGQGIDPRIHQIVIAVSDDDPGQVASVDALANKLGIMMEVRRIISPEQKRAGSPTPPGERVIEMRRGGNMRLMGDMVRVQASLFEAAIKKHLLHIFAEWLPEAIDLQGKQIARQTYTEKEGLDHYANGAISDFMRDHLNTPEFRQAFMAMVGYNLEAGEADTERAALQNVRDEFAQKAHLIVEKFVQEEVDIAA